MSGILLPMLGVSTARAEPSHYPEPVDTATFPANEDPLTFEIRYLLRPDGWLLDPNLLGSGVVVWKETASGRERVLSVGVQGLCQPPIEAECRPANEWITERFTVGSTNEAFFLRIVGTQSIFCDWDPGPCPFGDPRPHMNPALYAIDSPGIGGYLRICDGGDPPNCPDPTPDQCDAESGPIGNRELVVAGTYAG
ncbi:MAG: hypothetical protein ACKVVT_08000, partial [Dehalococcoidia bacterium]